MDSKPAIFECSKTRCVALSRSVFDKEKIIDFKFADTLEKSKQLRVDNQYYLKNIPVAINQEELSGLLLKIRSALDNMTNGILIKARNLITRKPEKKNSK